MGRPSKLTPTVAERIYTALRSGNFRDVAACYAGVAPNRMSQWFAQGDPDHPNTRPVYQEFRRKVLEIEAELESKVIATIIRAGNDDPRHLKWWAERKFPARWGRKDRLTVSGPDNGPIPILNVNALEDDDLERLITYVEKMQAAGAASGDEDDGE